MKLNVNVTGLDAVMKQLAQKAGTQALQNADKITETYTRKMANESAAMAPVKSSDLRNSIAASPERVENGVWQYGSDLAYARRQEYEHKSQKGFIRRSVWNNREPYREAIRKEFSQW
ncbi:hypothetical protein [Sporosarcina sp. ITBMC105]